MRELSAKLTEGETHTPLKLRSISRLQILTTVKFDDQPCSCTIEIRNVITDCFFAFESAPGSLLNNHTIVSVPIGSYFFGVSLQEGFFFIVVFHVLSLRQKLKIFATSLVRGRLWCGVKSHISHYTERCIEVRP